MQANAEIKKGGKEQPVVANVDWLGVTIRFSSLVDWQSIPAPAGMAFRIMTGTAIWKTRVLLISEDGAKVATILCEPKSEKLFQPNVGLIEIANEWLYHGHGWDFIFYRIRSVAPFEILGISRVDLCADFTPTKEQRKIILGLATGDYYVAGKKHGAGFWSQGQRSEFAGKLAEWTMSIKLPHQQSWGHKTSDVKWKLYYKTRELLEVEDKPWIKDHWQAEGLDVKDVWRLEVSLHYPHRLLMADKVVSYAVFDAEWLALLRSLYQTRFQVRANQGHKDRSNDTEVDFIPALARWGCGLKCRTFESTRKRFGRITLLRKLVASLADESVLCNDTAREGVLWLVQSIVEEDQLYDYFMAMTDRPLYEWIEEERVKAYTRDGSLSSMQVNV